MPDGCQEEKCDFFVSWIPHNDTIEFHLSSAINHDDVEWTALAFSYDQAMVSPWELLFCQQDSFKGIAIFK